MRLSRLDLLRFGHFTETSLAFPQGACDLHIVFGPNEAGKSSTLAAIGSLFFKIDPRSDYNFLHAYPDMLLGGVVEAGGETLEFRRRKGRVKTLRDKEDAPYPEGEELLRSFLGGADQAFFERMFSLNHERLHEGGRQILEAEDDVAQLLFAAGAGLGGLRQTLTRLREEADGLWGRKAKKERRFTQAKSLLSEADAELAAATVSANAWEKISKRHKVAEAEAARLTQALEAKEQERSRLARIRRTLPRVTRWNELSQESAVLGPAPNLPEDARETFTAARHAELSSLPLIEAEHARLQTLEESLEALASDPAILAEAEAVNELHARRIEVGKALRDLPDRYDELAAIERRLAQGQRDLGWSPIPAHELAERLPPRTLVAGLRAHYAKLPALQQVLAKAEEEERKSRKGLPNLLDRVAAQSALPDRSLLEALTEAIKQRNLLAELQTSGREVAQLTNSLEVQRQALRPLDLPLPALRGLLPPDRRLVERYHEEGAERGQERRDCQNALRDAERRLKRSAAERAGLSAEIAAVSGEDLVALRARRDLGWSLIRRRYIEGAPVAPETLAAFASAADGIPAAFEAAMTAADDAADRRFSEAETLTKIAALDRDIAEAEEDCAQLQGRLRDLESAEEAAVAAWVALWPDLPEGPRDPATMLTWMDKREELLASAAALDLAEGEREALGHEAEQYKQQLQEELADASDLSLAILLQVAEQAVLAGKTQAVKAAGDRTRLDEIKAEVKERVAAVAAAQAALEGWQAQSRTDLAALHLDPALPPEAMQQALETLTNLKTALDEAKDLRFERIAKIERDAEGFNADVAALAARTEEPARQASPAELCLALEKRLAKAESTASKQETLRQDIAALRDSVEDKQRKLDERRNALRVLQELAGGEAVDLDAAIKIADAVRAAAREADDLQAALQRDGDGLSFEALLAECADAKPDAIIAEEKTVLATLKDLKDERETAQVELIEARQALAAIGGGDAAAQAAARRQEALAELSTIAERSLQLRSMALLLQWGLERFRREQQGPLLRRAGRLFEIVTGGAFEGLSVDFDESDRPHLFGARRGGRPVPVTGMSSGTVDQLYLALRLASVEDYLQQGRPLPFIADDLFINFDDARAAAGLKVLADLATKTQVLVFTHHSHLVDLARETLGPALSLVRLPDRPLEAAGDEE
ncbi:MAG: AAA family ATPase [Pseudomonadota bacterium]